MMIMGKSSFTSPFPFLLHIKLNIEVASSLLPQATFLSSQGISSSGQSSEVINNNGFDSVKQASSGDFHTVEEHNRRSPSFNYINPQSQVTDVQLTLVGSSETARIIAEDVLTSQDSFGRWNYVNDESLQTLDCLQFDAPISSGDKSDAFGIMDQFYMQVPIFNIVAISPEWTYSTVETKVFLFTLLLFSRLLVGSY